MTKANFFIIGAPKCGTTSLAAWLGAHTNIYFSKIKEPHFFNTNGLRIIKTLPDYDALWKNTRPQHIAIGEASTHYLFSPEAVPNILKYNPKAKFIVCVRNPIEMAQALHAERVWQGRETAKDFKTAWNLQEERLHGNYIPKTMLEDPERLQYGPYCKLGEQLARLFSLVDRTRVCVIVLDDMARDAKQEYERVLAFLGIPSDGRQDFPVYNPRKQTKNIYFAYMLRLMHNVKRMAGLKYNFGLARKLKGWNTNPRKRESISADLRDELVAYFKDDVALLGAILERNLIREWSL